MTDDFYRRTPEWAETTRPYRVLSSDVYDGIDTAFKAAVGLDRMGNPPLRELCLSRIDRRIKINRWVSWADLEVR